MPDKTTNVYKNFWIFILAAVILLFVSLTFYLQRLQTNLRHEVAKNIMEAANVEANFFKSKIKEERQTVNALANIMAQYYTITDLDSFIDILDRENNNNDFIRMGIIMPDGSAYFDDHSVVKDLLSKEDMEKLFDGQTITSDPIQNPYNDEKMIITAAPVLVYGKPQTAVFAAHSQKYYENLLERSKYGGNGYSYIINVKSDFIIYSGSDEALRNALNLSELDKDVSFEKPENMSGLIQQIMQNKKGMASLYLKHKHRFMVYIPLEINDWHLLFVIPTKPFKEQVNKIMFMSIALCAEIALIFSFLMLHIKNTERKSKKELYKHAFIDPLTEIGNLNKLKMDLPNLLKEHPNTEYAMVLLDIDKFKVINELYGYRQGDMVLVHLSNVLKEKLSPQDLFARIAGDKFVFITQYINKEEIEARLKDICSEISTCYASTDLNYKITLNCGIYIIDRILPFYLMLDRVNLACAEAKNTKGVNYAFYRNLSIRQILTEKAIENNMREALQDNQFKIYFQPKVNLKTLKMDGAEILVRWLHPAKGLIMPDVFIPIFERNGFILDLDMFMLTKSAEMLRSCLDEGLNPVRLAVNFSRLHINDPLFCENFKKTADFYKIPSHLLEAEITESTLLDNLDKMKEVIENFHKNGYLISIDDFGAGYSSLNVLKNLRFDTLKLDKEFLKTEKDEERAKQIIAGTVNMLKSLNTTIVAEGVETPEQARFLTDIGCDKGQGYLFSKPVPIEEFKDMLKNNDFSAKLKTDEKPEEAQEQK